MPGSMFESDNDKMLREMYGEDAEKAGAAWAAPKSTEAQQRDAARQPAAGDGLRRQRQAFAARRQARKKQQDAYRALVEQREDHARRVGAARRRMMATGIVCLAVLVCATAFTASSGGNSVLQRMLPAPYTERALQWNGLRQYARTNAFMKENEVRTYTGADGADQLTALAAEAEFAALYEEAFQNWAEACWHYAVDDDIDWAETCVSIAISDMAAIMNPDYYEADLPAELTERCRYGVTLFLRDIGTEETLIRGLSSGDYEIRYEAEDAIERYLCGQLAQQAEPYLTSLGYDLSGEGDVS